MLHLVYYSFDIYRHPTRTGMASVRLAASFIPTVIAPPPVMTIPAGVCPPKPLFLISSPIIAKISLSLGRMIPSMSVFCETFVISSGKFNDDKSISSEGF